jgi:DNA polymerase-3 subunit alpha
MRIAVKLAGFSETETDNLRKAIGKKKADLMASIRNDFIAGCKNVGLVDEETAKEIFGWIEKSSRYSFNKCLSPYTVVITEDGEKILGEVKVGDKVLAPNGDKDEFVEILDVMNSGLKEVYEIEMEDGKTITCSIDHKFLCSDGKKRPLFEILDGDLDIMCID